MVSLDTKVCRAKGPLGLTAIPPLKMRVSLPQLVEYIDVQGGETRLRVSGAAERRTLAV